MARQADAAPAPDECLVVSPSSWLCPAALEGLESSSSPTRLYAALTSSTCRGDALADHLCQAERARATASFPGTACPYAALVAGAVGTQCAHSDSSPTPHHSVRCAGQLRRLCGPLDWLASRCFAWKRASLLGKASSPSALCCLLAPTLPQILSSAARFAPLSERPASLLESQSSPCLPFHGFLNDYLINKLVAQFVGKAGAAGLVGW